MVCSASLCHDRGRPLWGLNVVNLKSQIVKRTSELFIEFHATYQQPFLSIINNNYIKMLKYDSIQPEWEKKYEKTEKNRNRTKKKIHHQKNYLVLSRKKKLIKLDKSDPEAKKEAWIRFLVFECVKVSNYINFTSFHQQKQDFLLRKKNIL